MLRWFKRFSRTPLARAAVRPETPPGFLAFQVHNKGLFSSISDFLPFVFPGNNDQVPVRAFFTTIAHASEVQNIGLRWGLVRAISNAGRPRKNPASAS